MIYLVGCKCFSVVTDYATLLICWNNQMINWLIIGKFTVLNHWCHLLNVRASFTVKGHDKADLVSRRSDIHPDDVHLRRPVEILLSGWMVKYLICVIKAMRRHCWYYQRILSPLMMTSWPTWIVFSSCSYFAAEKTRWEGHGLIKSFDGLYTYHDRLVIPRPAQDLCILLLTECSYNVGHQNWQRLLTTLWKRFLRERVYIVGLQGSFLQLWCLQLLKPDLARFFCLVSLGVTDYP
jgi:hypothetical protein